MTLFDYAQKSAKERDLGTGNEPLAARMRPRTLDEFWGQSHILAKGRLLRRAIEADQLSSVIFYGPPGTGKTTLARIIANSTRSKFLSLNAVLCGVKDIRDAIESAKQNYNLIGRKSILFIDEVHRFNKSQQDALLPWVENGTITLIGATTENPYFEVNKALVSRSRIFQLMPLAQEDLRAIAFQALHDDVRGYGLLPVSVHEDAMAHLTNVANGDARALLNALELAVTTTAPNAGGVIEITLEVAEESIQQRAVLYDKEGDAHFDTISAFIKSIRGSDPDAALYWLARMVAAGESANFIFRRLLISACEDIGLADPHAVSVVSSCAQAFDRIGLPEGRYHLAHATLYLATAPKSNSSMGFFDALHTVEQESSYDVPNHLKDASRDKDGLGHGAGYLYPHAYRDHWVAQQYLPDGLQGRIFYHPGNMGYEAGVAEKVAHNREAQLEASNLEQQASGISSEERWIGRTFDGGAQKAEFIRGAIFANLELKENSRVLDINAGTGLLSFEALRRCKTGGVFSIIFNDKAGQTFEGLMERQPEISRAQICKIDDFSALQIDSFRIQEYDAIIGRNFIQKLPDLNKFFSVLKSRLAREGKIALLNAVPSRAPFLCDLVPGMQRRDAALFEAWRQAEAQVRMQEEGYDLSVEKIDHALQNAGFANAHIRVLELPGKLTITPSLFSFWFSHNEKLPSYMDKLGRHLNKQSCEQIARWAFGNLRLQAVDWRSVFFLITAQ